MIVGRGQNVTKGGRDGKGRKVAEYREGAGGRESRQPEERGEKNHQREGHGPARCAAKPTCAARC